MPWGRDRLPTPVLMGFPGSSVNKESACNAGSLNLIPRLERSPLGGHDNPLQYISWRIPVDRGAWVGYNLWGQEESDTAE